MFIYFLFMHCLIEEFLPGKPLKYVNNIPPKTVVLIESELVFRNHEGEKWQSLPPQDTTKVNLSIFSSKSNDWQEMHKDAELITNYKRIKPVNNFFFTSTDDAYFLYQLEATLGSGKLQYAFKTNFYEGRFRDPSIMSHADSQIRDLSNSIEQAMGIILQTSNVQKLDAMRDVEYKHLIAGTGNMIFFIVVIKILTFYCMFYYFNKKLRDFYVTKKIARN